MATKTKKPTGLKVERNGSQFTFSWTIGDADYEGGQSFEYRLTDNAKWTSVSVTGKQTSVTRTISLSRAVSISFRVKGKRKSYKKKDGTTVTPSTSSWATKTGAWKAKTPTAPSVSCSRTSVNSGRFNVTHKADTKGGQVATYVQVQTCTSQNNANPPTSGWSAITNISGLADVNSNYSYTEQNEVIAATGVVRWFRARSTGNGGTTGWVYARHAYSTPQAPALQSASARKVPQNANTAMTAKWQSVASLLKPIDEESVQYVIGTPTDNACNAPATGWQTAMTVVPSGKDDTVTAYVSTMTALDECMWMRVEAKHDNDYVSYSRAVRVITEALTPPELNAVPNFTTGDVTINLTIGTRCTVAKHAIFYRDPKNPRADVTIAVLAPGATTATVNVPAIIGMDRSCFGAYAFVGTNNGLSVNALMRSAIVLDEDINIVEPDAPGLEQLDGTSVFVNFTWKWKDASAIEIAYANNEYAWESNQQPTSYTVEDKGVTRWVIQGLEVGKAYYFRTRYIGTVDDEDVMSGWSNPSVIDLATDPATPTLVLNRGYVMPGGSISASWNYVNEDNSPQASAQVCLVTIENDEIIYGDVLAHAGVAQNVLVPFEDSQPGDQYYLAVKVEAESGRSSEWSEPVAIYVPEEPTATLGGNFVQNGVLASLDGNISSQMSVDNTTGNYTLGIIRAYDYHINRPDDDVSDGFEGETIWTRSGTFSCGRNAYYAETYNVLVDDLIGSLDDNAGYRLILTVIDGYGQQASDQIDFTVNWTHKASIADPAVSVDTDYGVVMIAPVIPEGYVQGDTFDIYRITVDQPELIVRNGSYGTIYVDPYPGFGPLCGHRVVAKTETGSYITEDNTLAWYDLGSDDGDTIDDKDMVIDADGIQIRLPYNIELSHRWAKDFQRTSYLGGAVHGDWNPAVLRDLTAKTVIVRDTDTDELLDLRDVAAYAGPAHIRTPDGSSFACDIQISEDSLYADSKVTYNLTIKGIDAQDPDGMTLAEWQRLNPPEIPEE